MKAATDDKAQGAGDQGMMFGFAVNETPELMPLPITIAHQPHRPFTPQVRRERFQPRPSPRRQERRSPWRTTAQTDQTALHRHHRSLSAQHDPELKPHRCAEARCNEKVIQPVLADFEKYVTQDIKYHVNPTGIFVIGGPQADTGVTGRKIIVDTYGGYARHGGGAFSGKDPSKVDRSAAYAARFIAKNIVSAGLASSASRSSSPTPSASPSPSVGPRRNLRHRLKIS